MPDSFFGLTDGEGHKLNVVCMSMLMLVAFLGLHVVFRLARRSRMNRQNQARDEVSCATVIIMRD